MGDENRPARPDYSVCKLARLKRAPIVVYYQDTIHKKISSMQCITTNNSNTVTHVVSHTKFGIHPPSNNLHDVVNGKRIEQFFVLPSLPSVLPIFPALLLTSCLGTSSRSGRACCCCCRRRRTVSFQCDTQTVHPIAATSKPQPVLSRLLLTSPPPRPLAHNSVTLQKT